MTHDRTPLASLQLYSVREHVEADLDATLARIAGLGLRCVEPFEVLSDPAGLASALGRHGLIAPTAHAPLLSTELRFGDRVVELPPREVFFAAARQVGVRILIDPFVAPDRWDDPAEVARTADLLNETAEAAASYGLTVGYHNHAHEFAHSFSGVTAYEYFASRLAPEVALEVDLYWAAVGGQDVPALLRRLGPRVRAVHVKDGPLAAAASADPMDPTSLGQLPAGQGDVPLAEALAASDADYAVLEFDAYAGDIWAALGEGVEFLSERGVALDPA